MGTGSRPPNRLLAWERLQRGWSHEELRAQLVRVMVEDGDYDTGLTRNTVRRWESGERTPEPRYRKYLVRLFGRSADRLGLLDADELSLCPAPTQAQGRELESLGLFATMLGDKSLDRETFLQGLLALGTALTFPSRPSDNEGMEPVGMLVDAAVAGTPLSARTVDAYAAITAGHRHLYWESAPSDLYRPVAAHLELGSRLMAASGTDTQVTRLSQAVAESAMLAGRLAFFDLRRPQHAELAFQTALDATMRAGDHPLAAAVLAHMSFVSAESGDAARSRDLIEGAHAHAARRTPPLLRVWLGAVATETAGTVHDPTRSQKALGHASDLLGAVSPGDDAPAWFDFFDTGRLDGFAGQTHLMSGHPERARPSLERSLTRLATHEGKQRVVVLADLARSYVQDDPEAACLFAERALDQLGSSWYATGWERIRSVHRELTTHAPACVVLNLESRLREAYPTGRS
ncbi:MAG: helix-turn-helix protein [Actinomycetota bacterium]|nr:helix-turn-helix protein [Actinomycetota bacterium]